MTLDEVFRELRARNEPFPFPPRLPTFTEVAAAEERLGVSFHHDFRRYLLEVSDVVFGTKEPVTLGFPEAHTDLIAVAERAWQGHEVPRDLLPICEDNADFYCLDRSGAVVFWSHNGSTSESWQNLAEWIADVWLGSE